MARRHLARRRVGSSIVHATMHVVGTRLGDSCCCDVVIILVDGVLHLFQELVDVDQIILGPGITHGRQLVLNGLRAAVTTTASAAAAAAANGYWGRHGLVLRDGTTAQDGELQVLQTQQPLTDRGIAVGVKLASLQVAEKLVESIVTALFRFV